MLNPYAPPRLPPEANAAAPHRQRDATQVYLANICWQLPLAVFVLFLSHGAWPWSQPFALALKVVGFISILFALLLSILMWRRRDRYLGVAGGALCGIVGNVLMLLLSGASLTFIVHTWLPNFVRYLMNSF